MDWIERPQDCIFDIRPAEHVKPDTYFPPMACLVVNAQNERLGWVFHVNFKTDMVGRYKTRINEAGVEVTDIEINSETNTAKLKEEWIHVPGVKVIPMPPGFKESQELLFKENKKKIRKYKADSQGVVSNYDI